MTSRLRSAQGPGFDRRGRSRTGAFHLQAAASRWGRILALDIASCLLASPAASAARIDKVIANEPPGTILSSGPPDSSTTDSRVHFYWTGTDPDGTVDHFDFIMVDHPRSKDSIGPGGTDPVIITVPSPDDPRWTSTTAMDSFFVASADTLRRNPRPGPGETPADVLLHPFERWHTFFVRAVDDAGAPDPTPAYRSFNAQTLAPTVHLLPPVVPNTTLIVPPVVVFHWDGKDPLNEHAFRQPVASRYVIIDSKIDLSYPFLYTSYPESLYSLPQRFSWSPWQAWDLPDGAGRKAVITGLEPVQGTSTGFYIFAVQAMDEAGAITPVFDFQSSDLNNVALIRVQGTAGPVLVLREEVLGTHTFVDGSLPVRMEIAGGQTVAFRWSADASHYGGTITGYRYGWDIVNPDDDQEWSPWASSTQAPPRTFAAGTHRFFLQGRDDTGSWTEAVLELMVHAVTRNRDLLWVDDADHLTDEVTESAEDSRWLSMYQQLTETSDLHFDPDLDVYDIRDNRDESPTLPLLLDYKVVVWSVRSGSTGSSGLRRTAQFVDPFPTRNQNTGRNFNILNVYIANGGKLWINGFQPAKQLWPDERFFGHEFDPVNVTHWDDPREPHPGIDSVGTTSLLYKMGVEMFDFGSSSNITHRRDTVQFCYGLRPAAPGIPVLQLHSSWGQGGTGGRSNVEIYDMPGALANQQPPLRPPPGKTRVLYTYVSHVPEDSSQNISYPLTADKQPMFLVAKAAPDDPYYNLALCGFEPFYLESNSHARLVQHVLLQEMGLGPTPVFLRHLTAEVSAGSVRIRWEVEASSDPAEFRLQASAGGTEWTLPFTSIGPRQFAATDESPHLAGAGTVTYSLYAQEAGAPWVLLGQETVVFTGPPRVVQLLPPHPNPFNPRVMIPFVLPTRQHARLTIYAPDGRRIALLLDAIRPAGPGSVSWDGTDASGRPVASGLYLARLDAGGASLAEKLLLMK